jgi:hypothetical protein
MKVIIHIFFVGDNNNYAGIINNWSKYVPIFLNRRKEEKSELKLPQSKNKPLQR